MLTDNKDFEAFASEYHNEEKEILVLTSDQTGGAGKFYDSWDASQYFLAYIDLKTNKLKKGDGRINWLLSDEECRQYGTTWPFNFNKGTIYRIKVRELIDRTVPEGRLPSYYNRFMIVDVLDKNIQNNELLSFLTEYRTPIEIVDEKLGKFELNKDYKTLQGQLNWINHDVSVSIEVEIDDRESWTNGIRTLRIFFEQQEQQDLDLRTYAGEQLTDLANDWREDGSKEITKSDFIKRISLSDLVISSTGDFTAYYNDDDMFYGHIIDVSGNIKTGISSANIAG
ncbi:MAG: DUF2262 domain-containing protein [Ferruginibacter sp.]